MREGSTLYQSNVCCQSEGTNRTRDGKRNLKWFWLGQPARPVGGNPSEKKPQLVLKANPSFRLSGIFRFGKHNKTGQIRLNLVDKQL